MKMVLTDKAPRRHGLPGAEVEITTNCVRFFNEQGWAVPVDEIKKTEEARLREGLEAEYERVTGKSADARWKDETLRAKIEEAQKPARTYGRRDMRAED